MRRIVRMIYDADKFRQSPPFWPVQVRDLGGSRDSRVIVRLRFPRVVRLSVTHELLPESFAGAVTECIADRGPVVSALTHDLPKSIGVRDERIDTIR